MIPVSEISLGNPQTSVFAAPASGEAYTVLEEIVNGASIVIPEAFIKSKGNNRTLSNTITKTQILSVLDYFGIEYEVNKDLDICDFDGYPGLKVHVYVAPQTLMPDGLIIDIRNQDTSGSISEKFPLFYIRSQFIYPVKTLYIIDGLEFKKSNRCTLSREWLKKMAGEPESRIEGVLEIYEFNQWIREKIKQV